MAKGMSDDLFHNVTMMLGIWGLIKIAFYDHICTCRIIGARQQNCSTGVRESQEIDHT
mgnify:CR=1 FL=1